MPIALDDKGIKDLLGFARYLSWADLVRRAHEAEFRRRGEAGTTGNLWGAEFAWMSYWYGSLFVVIEAYESIGYSDPVVDSLLSHPGGYKKLLWRFRNGIFHYQADPIDPKLLDLLNRGEEHVLWVYALHDEFVRLSREQVDRFGMTEEVRAEVKRVINNLTGWLPDDPARRDMDLTLERIRGIVSREPSPELQRLHADLRAAVVEIPKITGSYEQKRERFRRTLLQRLGVTIVEH